MERNKSKTGERKITILKIKNMTAKDFIEQTYWVKSRQSTFPLMNEVIAKTEKYQYQNSTKSTHFRIGVRLKKRRNRNDIL